MQGFPQDVFIFLAGFRCKTQIAGVKHMYKRVERLHHSFLDFNQPMGLHMNPDNRWVKMADWVPWDEFESKYAELFTSSTDHTAEVPVF
jgi:hypothetical protein